MAEARVFINDARMDDGSCQLKAILDFYLDRTGQGHEGDLSARGFHDGTLAFFMKPAFFANYKHWTKSPMLGSTMNGVLTRLNLAQQERA